MSTYEERILGTTPKKKNFARLHTRRNAVSNRGGLPPLYNTDSTFLTGINGPPKGFATNSLARKVVPSARNLKTRLSMALSGESKTTDQKIQDKVGDLHYPPGFFSPQQIKEKG